MPSTKYFFWRKCIEFHEMSALKLAFVNSSVFLVNGPSERRVFFCYARNADVCVAMDPIFLRNRNARGKLCTVKFGYSEYERLVWFPGRCNRMPLSHIEHGAEVLHKPVSYVGRRRRRIWLFFVCGFFAVKPRFNEPPPTNSMFTYILRARTHTFSHSTGSRCWENGKLGWNMVEYSARNNEAWFVRNSLPRFLFFILGKSIERTIRPLIGFSVRVHPREANILVGSTQCNEQKSWNGFT